MKFLNELKNNNMFLIDLIYVTYNFIKSLLLLSLEGRHQTLVTTLGSLFKGLDSFGGHAKVSEQQIIYKEKCISVEKTMAGSSGRYVKSKGSNPFFDDEDDVDDEEFLQRAPNRFNNFGGKLANSLSGGNNSFQPLDGGENQSADERRRQLLMEKQKIEERTLQASGRAKGMLYETEQIGISTAEVCT